MRLLTPLFLAALMSCALAAQSDVDPAIGFFRQGGAYCFRLAPEGVAMAEETEWTVMLLTAASNHKNEFRIRTLDPGSTGLRGEALAAAGTIVTGVWRGERLREEFFEHFAAGIDAGTLRARVVKLAPGNLAGMKMGERAEVYLKFADKGSQVSFASVGDLTADEFKAFETYMPD